MTQVPLLVLIAGLGLSSSAPVRIVPQPQYFECLKLCLALPPAGSVVIRVSPGEKIKLAAEFLRTALVQTGGSFTVSVQTAAASGKAEGPVIHLWNYQADRLPGLALNFLDREVLADSHRYGQSYVIRTPDARSLWVVGNSDQGVLFGAMTVRQLIRRAGTGAEIQGAYVRDYPDFEFRAAADWLLNVECNRWALDRGQGIDVFAQLCERKLDAALRFKINMIAMDGFGWGLDQRFKEYGPLMRRLNRYARARGISLCFGGYGAGYGLVYQGGPIYEDAPYLGEVFKNVSQNRHGHLGRPGETELSNGLGTGSKNLSQNRHGQVGRPSETELSNGLGTGSKNHEQSPDGPTYRCMGFPARHTFAKEIDPAVLGTCRSNDELNRRKAEELRHFVEAVEPGAVYIHHEDFSGFDGAQSFWKQRCERCRARWSNDALAARDGGAGALAHGYSALVRAVNTVKNPDGGYDAARDCQIILVSPAYSPDSPASDDWSEVLELWQNIAVQLPRANNIQFGFREVFRQKWGGGKWIDHVVGAMNAVGVRTGVYLFFAGGADNYFTDYPLSGAPSLNAAFLGARTMYNFSGDFYGEPMAVINAEYSWNAHAPGGCDPLTYEEASTLYHRYVYDQNQPEAIFGAGGLYHRACALLYGEKAGPVMADFYRESAWIPDVEIQAPKSSRAHYGNSYLPATWNRAYAIPTHWRHLALDSKTWGPEIDNEKYLAAFRALKIDRQELHRRLARRWSVVAELNQKGARYIDRALAFGPPPAPEEDLKFLRELFRVYQPFAEGLADFHSAFHLFLTQSSDSQSIAFRFERACIKGRQARDLAAEAFPCPLDPSGGEVGTLRRLLDQFVESAAAMQKRTVTGPEDRALEGIHD